MLAVVRLVPAAAPTSAGAGRRTNRVARTDGRATDSRDEEPGQTGRIGRPGAEKVFEFAAGRRIRMVWLNEAGGLTFEIGDRDDDRCFIMWQPARRAGLQAGARRLR